MTPSLEAAFRAADRLPEVEQRELAERILADLWQREHAEDSWIERLTAPHSREVVVPIPVSRR